MKNLVDIALIAQIITLKNPRAFKELMERHQDDIRRYLLNLTGGNRSLADDLAQECFIKVYQRLDSFKQLASFKSWLYRIATNCFYDYLRSKKLGENIEDVDDAGLIMNEQHNVGIEIDINGALQTLTVKERTCITLFHVEDMKADKIAAITDIPINTVRSHLKRGRKKMRDFLSANGYDTNHFN